MRLWSCRCGASSDGSQERVATSTSGMHVVKQSMHLRSRQSCHFNVKVADKACNHFEDVCLGFYQPLVDCHLEVTAKTFDELFKIKANIAVGEV